MISKLLKMFTVFVLVNVQVLEIDLSTLSKITCYPIAILPVFY